MELKVRHGLGLGSGFGIGLGSLAHLANQHYSAISFPQNANTLRLAGLSGLFSTVTVRSIVMVRTMVRLSSVPFNNVSAKRAYRPYQPEYCASAQGDAWHHQGRRV